MKTLAMFLLCAWVAWHQGANGQWRPLEGFESKTQCENGLMTRAQLLGKSASVEFSTVEILLFTTSSMCLPVPTDPRDPKRQP